MYRAQQITFSGIELDQELEQEITNLKPGYLPNDLMVVASLIMDKRNVDGVIKSVLYNAIQHEFRVLFYPTKQIRDVSKWHVRRRLKK